MLVPLWGFEFGDDPFVAAATHDEHFVRAGVAGLLRLGGAVRSAAQSGFAKEFPAPPLGPWRAERALLGIARNLNSI